MLDYQRVNTSLISKHRWFPLYILIKTTYNLLLCVGSAVVLSNYSGTITFSTYNMVLSHSIKFFYQYWMYLEVQFQWPKWFYNIISTTVVGKVIRVNNSKLGGLQLWLQPFVIWTAPPSKGSPFSMVYLPTWLSHSFWVRELIFQHHGAFVLYRWVNWLMYRLIYSAWWAYPWFG